MVLVLTALFGGMVSAQAVDRTDVTLVGDAYYDSDNGWYVLTEEETWQSGALWFSQVRCNDNFSISLDFYTGHADHEDSLGGADATAYTEDGRWHHLKVENRRGVCTVYVDGTQALQQTGVEPNGQYEIGITAATGAGYNFHAVKNIQLTEAVWSGSSEWADDELERAQQKNLIPEVLYDKDLSQTITREQLATMLCRVYKNIAWENWTLDTDGQFALDTSGVKPFADDPLISAYAKPSVYFMVKHSVINGVGDNKFAPKYTTSQEEAIGYAMATREQALVMSLRSLENLS